MLALISRRHNTVNGCRNFSLSLNHCYSASASAAQPQKNSLLENFLINTVGYSEEAAIKASASRRLSRLKPVTKDFNLVLNYFKDLGFGRTQMKSIVVSNPGILFTDLDKTLKPKIQILEDLGLSGPDLVRVLMGNKSLLSRSLDSCIKPRVEFLRNLLGGDDKVVLALRRCSFLLGNYAHQKITGLIPALKELGFSDEKVSKLVLANPRSILGLTPERVEEVGHRVENHLGIPSKSAMFLHGFLVLCSSRESTIDLKRTVFRSFEWSDLEISKLFKTFPYVMRFSEAKIKEALNFFMEELGYDADYLASHHALFTVSLETRVKPRNEVLKILNEKKLRERKTSLYSVVCLPETKFVRDYLFPYKNQIPDVYESYMSIHLEKKIEGP